MEAATPLQQLKDIRIEDYTYDLPDGRIAKFPLRNREDSKLLLYDGGTLSERRFAEVPALLRQGQTLVFNNTKVIHARLLFRKPTGALIEIFCLEPYEPLDYALNFAARGECSWTCLVGNLKKWKEGSVQTTFLYQNQQHILCAEKCYGQQGEIVVRFTWDADADFGQVLEQCGQIPIPPYLNRPSEQSDEIRYQTVYSHEQGSVAAPTAGLHFTAELLDRLRAQGIRTCELTLHVGAGTFRPVKAPCIGEHNMHTEHILVSRSLVQYLHDKTADIIAVGTTSVRTLESLYWMGVKRLAGDSDFRTVGQWEAYTLPDRYTLREAMQALLGYFDDNCTDILKAATTIIIVPGYRFRVIDALFTNFHQPQSTLLLLVAAAVGEDWRHIYRYALDNNFRFLSYGDSSLLKINTIK